MTKRKTRLKILPKTMKAKTILTTSLKNKKTMITWRMAKNKNIEHLTTKTTCLIRNKNTLEWNTEPKTLNRHLKAIVNQLVTISIKRPRVEESHSKESAVKTNLTWSSIITDMHTPKTNTHSIRKTLTLLGLKTNLTKPPNHSKPVEGGTTRHTRKSTRTTTIIESMMPIHNSKGSLISRTTATTEDPMTLRMTAMTTSSRTTKTITTKF